MPDLTETIEAIVTGPAEVSSDAGTVKAHDPLKVMEVDRYLAGKTAAPNAYRGLRFTKLTPPGAS